MITYKFLERSEFLPLLNEYRPKLFVDSASIDLEALYSESENDKSKILAATFSTAYRLHLTAWKEEQFIGWSFGYQKNGDEFYMCNSAVLPEFRRQKIYSELMNKIVAKAVQDGFKEITSKHHADNNAVIIPKLKAGFVIQGFEINPRFGLMINLICYSNPSILDVHRQRTGFKKTGK